MRKVTWPTREEAQRLTVIVLGVAFAFALFLGALDFAFSELVGLIVNLVAGA
jgi:preprotein translocase subunit SecE